MKIKQEITKEICIRRDELSSYLKAIKYLSNKSNLNFIIFAHYRTGSTLLANLLNCHPEIFCDTEIFLKFLKSKFNKVFFPDLYITGKLAKKKNRIYGFDLKLYQLKELNICYSDQQHQDFLLNLYQNDCKILYLRRRNLFRQEASSLMGVASS